MKNHLKYLLILLFTACSFSGSAQSNIEDVVYLKNGDIIRGQIIRLLPDSSLTIEIVGGSQLVLAMNDVNHIEKESAYRIKKYLPEHILRDSGFYNTYELGFNPGYGIDNWNWSPFYTGFAMEIIMGHYFNPYFGLGAGTGIDAFSRYDNPMIPLFIRLEGNMLHRAITPYYFANTGYAFLWTNQVVSGHGGLYANAGIGLRYFTGRKSFWQFGVGYLFTHATIITTNWNGGITTQQLQINRMTLRVGLTF